MARCEIGSGDPAAMPDLDAAGFIYGVDGGAHHPVAQGNTGSYIVVTRCT